MKTRRWIAAAIVLVAHLVFLLAFYLPTEWWHEFVFLVCGSIVVLLTYPGRTSGAHVARSTGLAMVATALSFPCAMTIAGLGSNDVITGLAAGMAICGIPELIIGINLLTLVKPPKDDANR